MFLRASLKESQYAIYYYIYKCKKKKVIQIFYKDLSTRYDFFFDYDENRSLPFKRSLRNFDKELEEA